MNIKHRLLIFFAISLSMNHVFAEQTLYVSDEFEITMRTGPGTDRKILKNLRSGSKVIEIEAFPDSGYSLVRTEDGIEGYALSRYLMSQAAAKDRLITAQNRIKNLRSKIKELKDQLASLETDKNGLSKESTQLSQTKEKLEKELETIRRVSTNQIALYEENEELKGQVLNLRREIQTVEQENTQLLDRSARDWFMIGAGVCVIGIILGLVLPNIRFRRKQSWSSL
ncbi:MAG: TIGR04211 family SH3 domain-containing protein [Gammaproteobacteria bacterium]|nr:TIGR04211 family SH3 domain-containing protein [Gammaproteobacteria bacterium]MDH5730439.1 TIGR04211 family SH3 domain-containing protein [Gammaproteobacteria bacterium]